MSPSKCAPFPATNTIPANLVAPEKRGISCSICTLNTSFPFSSTPEFGVAFAATLAPVIPKNPANIFLKIDRRF